MMALQRMGGLIGRFESVRMLGSIVLNVNDDAIWFEFKEGADVLIERLDLLFCPREFRENPYEWFHDT